MEGEGPTYAAFRTIQPSQEDQYAKPLIFNNLCTFYVILQYLKRTKKHHTLCCEYSRRSNKRRRGADIIMYPMGEGRRNILGTRETILNKTIKV